MSLFKVFFFLFAGTANVIGQELYPVNEPASTLPAHVVGLRFGNHFHYKYNTAGHRQMLRIMYGVNHRLTLIGTVSLSNFHVADFPRDLNTYYNDFHNHKSKNISYPYQAEGVHLFTKWRFLSLDGRNAHLRFALYQELSFSRAIHLDAFPNLMGDQSGAGLGFIITKLKNRFSASLTSGVAAFFPYGRIDESDSITFKAGKALQTNLSLGYLLFPKVYKNYDDINISLYLEINNRFFGTPLISRNGYLVNTYQFQYLRKGFNIVSFPGIQFIIQSRTRIDLSAEIPLATNNNTGRYVMLMVSFQRYFY